MTSIRNTISKSNKYYISKHRYLEVKHHCLQYPEWEKEYNTIIFRKGPDPTGDEATRLASLKYKMDYVNEIAKIAGGDISDFLFKAVTQDLSFVTLSSLYEIPCGRDYYYERYRRFFYIFAH